MAYGNGYGNRGGYGNGGGYQRQSGYQNQSGGYQQQAPAPIDVYQEIVTRVDLLNQFKDVIVNEKGIPADEFFMMMPALGGWVTSILLKQEKGR